MVKYLCSKYGFTRPFDEHSMELNHSFQQQKALCIIIMQKLIGLCHMKYKYVRMWFRLLSIKCFRTFNNFL